MKSHNHWVMSLALVALPFLGGCEADEDPSLNSGGTIQVGESAGGPTGGDTPGAGEQMNSGGTPPLPTEPIEGCVGPEDVTDQERPQPATSEECATCEGAPAPDFILRDLSPTSCGVGNYYGLDAFAGRVTFVVLLRSTCGYCHGQLEKLEQMRFELLAMGYELYMVVINETDTEETIDLLTQRSQIPVLQDVAEVDAWRALSDPDPDAEADAEIESRIGGDKDDMYIYDAEGNLWRFLDDDDPAHSLNLSTDEGYTYLKDALIEALSD